MKRYQAHLTNKQSGFIETMVTKGEYESIAEAIRDAVACLMEKKGCGN